ncbi:MAG TPA: TIGR02147 family protein [bacterium]|nr:TIGR02147 family protein [bacterium]
MYSRPNIFLYEDYRVFLRDLYRHLKEVQRGFSHRFFSKKAGFTSPNMLQLVIDGKRNVTPRTVGKFIRGLKMNQQEGEFFAALVDFNQAATPEDKSMAFQVMTKSRKFREIHELSKEIFRFYTQWFHIVIREMIDLEGFRADPEWISQNLLPSISKEQAERALKLLLKLNLIKKAEKADFLQRTDPIIATPAEVKSLAVVNFHQSMMTLAAQSLSSVPGEERDVTSATVGLRQEDLPRIKKRIEEFRNTLLAEAESEKARPDRIYQLNIQLFPVTKRIEAVR